MHVDRRDVEIEEGAIDAGSAKSFYKGALRIRGKTATVEAGCEDEVEQL